MGTALALLLAAVSLGLTNQPRQRLSSNSGHRSNLSQCPLMTQSGHHCRCGLRNQVQSNEKNRQTYHNKKNEGSDAVVPIGRPVDEVSQRRRGEQKQ
jgi:hypothetical protein